VLHTTARLFDIRFRRPTRFLTLIALLLGGLTYALSFMPGLLGTTSLMVPLVLAPILFRRLLRLAWGPTARLWLGQVVSLLALISLAFWGIESLATRSVLNPLHELPIIYRLAKRPELPAQHVLPAAHGSSFPGLRWRSSGSAWLDRRANQVLVEAINPAREKAWGISLFASGNEKPVDRTRQDGMPSRSIRFTPTPDVVYSVSVDSTLLPGDLLRVYSLLPMATS
jgi:hypothetical protein